MPYYYPKQVYGKVKRVELTTNNTVLTDVVNYSGCGWLIGISWTDLDDVVQNEYIKIQLDDRVTSELGKDVGVTEEYIAFFRALMNDVLSSSDILATQPPIPFRNTLLVQAYRAAAGVSGLRVRVLYSEAG